MVNVGPLEILLVAIIALIVLGPARLPEVARSVGRGMREFRSALSGIGDDRNDREDGDYELDEPDEDEDVPEPDPTPVDEPASAPPAVEPPPLPTTPPGTAGNEADPPPADLPERS